MKTILTWLTTESLWDLGLTLLELLIWELLNKKDKKVFSETTVTAENGDKAHAENREMKFDYQPARSQAQCLCLGQACWQAGRSPSRR